MQREHANRPADAGSGHASPDAADPGPAGPGAEPGTWAALAQAHPGPGTATALATLQGAPVPTTSPPTSSTGAWAGVPTDGLPDLLVAAERLVAWAQSLSLSLLGELVDRLNLPLRADDPPHPQAPDLGQEVAAEVSCLLGTGNAAAHGKVQLARRLRRLPAVAEALARGEIDLTKARVICEETDHLDLDTAGQTADRALAGAGRIPPARLRARCRAAALAADPAATRERRQRHRRTGRDVTLQPGKDGLACVSAVLTEAESADLFARVQNAAAALLAADRAAGRRPRGVANARADALLALTHPAAGAAAGTGVPDDVGVVAGAGHPGAQVAITVPIAALLAGLTGPDDDVAWHLAGLDRFALGEVTGIGPVSGEEAADACLRACAQALQDLAGGRVGVRFIVTDHTGRAVATTGTTYTVPPLLRAAVEARDRTCRFPGCTRPAVRCDLDHVVPFPDGGTTTENLAALCRHHHRLKTHSGWATTLEPGGEQAWTSPLGRTYRTTPATWSDPYDLPDQLALPPDGDLDIWPDDPTWLDRLTADALEGLGPDRWALAG